MPKVFRSTSGFTLVELMIVIAIIVIMTGIGYIPYQYYTDRARVEKTIDTIGQNWILSHANVKNGITYENSNTGSNANIRLTFEKGKDTVDIVVFTGTNTTVTKPYNPIYFDKNISILSISGATETYNTLDYTIMAPYGTGTFSGTTVSGNPATPETKVTITVGYRGGTPANGRARNILLTAEKQ